MMKRTRNLLVVAGLVALAGGGVWLWEEVLEDRLIPKRWGVVEVDEIYRSGQLHPALVEATLRDHEIKVIVDLNQHEVNNDAQRAEERAAETLGIERILFPLSGDGTGDIEQYAQAIRRMHEARHDDQAVLVHCSAGVYRTGGVVAMYRVLVEGWTPERARAEMIDFHWDEDDPKLPRYLNENLATLASRLVELGVLTQVPDPLPRFPESSTSE